MADFQQLFRQARDAAAKGDFHTARRLYAELWRSPVWGRDREIGLGYAYACERSGDHSGALNTYRELIALYSGSTSEADEALAEESMIRLRELMAGSEKEFAGKIVDSQSDETEAFLISRLFDRGYAREVPSGELLCHKGDIAQHMWLLTDGQVDVVIPGQHTMRLSGTPSRPCLIGELSYFTGMRRAATLCSASQAHIVELPFDRIRTLLREEPDLYAMMEHLFRHRLVLRVLSQHDIFKLFNEVDRSRVTRIFENSLTYPGQALIEQGEEHPAAYMVQSGTLLMIREDADGEEQLLGSIHPGDLFHLGGLLRGFQAPYRVVAGTPAHLLRLNRTSFEPFMLQRPWLIKAILKHSRLAAEQQILHPEAKNLWAADRYFNMEGDAR